MFQWVGNVTSTHTEQYRACSWSALERTYGDSKGIGSTYWYRQCLLVHIIFAHLLVELASACSVLQARQDLVMPAVRACHHPCTHRLLWCAQTAGHQSSTLLNSSAGGSLLKQATSCWNAGHSHCQVCKHSALTPCPMQPSPQVVNAYCIAIAEGKTSSAMPTARMLGVKLLPSS